MSTLDVYVVPAVVAEQLIVVFYFLGQRIGGILRVCACCACVTLPVYMEVVTAGVSQLMNGFLIKPEIFAKFGCFVPVKASKRYCA